MRITGIDHVQLAMPADGEETARAFYAGVLGMTEVAKPPVLAARGGCWFESPGAVVHLGAEPGFTPAARAHPALLVADLDQARRDLQAAGAEVVDDTGLPDRRRFHTHDPFGNRIELIADGDGLSQRPHAPG